MIDVHELLEALDDPKVVSFLKAKLFNVDTRKIVTDDGYDSEVTPLVGLNLGDVFNMGFGTKAIVTFLEDTSTGREVVLTRLYVPKDMTMRVGERFTYLSSKQNYIKGVFVKNRIEIVSSVNDGTFFNPIFKEDSDGREYVMNFLKATTEVEARKALQPLNHITTEVSKILPLQMEYAPNHFKVVMCMFAQSHWSGGRFWTVMEFTKDGIESNSRDQAEVLSFKAHRELMHSILEYVALEAKLAENVLAFLKKLPTYSVKDMKAEFKKLFGKTFKVKAKPKKVVNKIVEKPIEEAPKKATKRKKKKRVSITPETTKPKPKRKLRKKV